MVILCRALDKRGDDILDILFLTEFLCCGYSLESSRSDDSNEYQQHKFWSGINENFKSEIYITHSVWSSDYVFAMFQNNMNTVYQRLLCFWLIW